MRLVLLACGLGVVLAGCGTGSGQPVATPQADSTSPPSVQGPSTRATIAAGAFVSPADLGPAWTTASPATTPCEPTYTRTAVRSVGFAEARGTLTETLALVNDVSATVMRWRQALRHCGYTLRDDALGDDALTARSADGADTVVATGTEGVLVVLHAHGELARAGDELDGWADLALGTSCVAAKDGCH